MELFVSLVTSAIVYLIAEIFIQSMVVLGTMTMHKSEAIWLVSCLMLYSYNVCLKKNKKKFAFVHSLLQFVICLSTKRLLAIIGFTIGKITSEKDEIVCYIGHNLRLTK